MALALSVISSLMLLIGGAILTALVQQSQSINSYEVYDVPLGIKVTFGVSLWLIWSAFAADMVSIIPYFLRYVEVRGLRVWASRLMKWLSLQLVLIPTKESMEG